MDVVLLILAERVSRVDRGFTFTDLADFGPILTLLIGFVSIFFIARSPRKKASWPLVTLLLGLSVWPLVPTLGLWFLAREFEAVKGAWPQAWANDPKDVVGQVSPRFDALFELIPYLEAFSGAWMIVFLGLSLAGRGRFPRWMQGLAWGVVVVSVGVFAYDPGALFTWWLPKAPK